MAGPGGWLTSYLGSSSAAVWESRGSREHCPPRKKAQACLFTTLAVSRQCEVTLGVVGGVTAVPNGWRNIKNTYNSTLLQCSNSCSHCRNIYSNPFLQNNSTGCSRNDLVPKKDCPKGCGDHLPSNVKVQNGTGEKS